MKGLKKLALATAVAAAPFAAQAGGMQPMNDSQMGDVTGQAGVTIELETTVDIAQMEYTQDTNGSFLMNNISIGGFGDDTFDVGIDIDLLDSGDALISLGPLAPSPVELGIGVGEFQISGDDGTATLMSNFNADIYFSQLDITAVVESQIERTSGDTQEGVGGLVIDVAFVVDDLSIDVDFAGMSISDFRMAGIGSMDTLRSGGDGQALATSTDAEFNPAVVTMNIGVGQASRPAALGGAGYGVANDAANVLRIDGINFGADMWIGDISIGGGSIGSVALHGMEVVADVAVYGRD